MDALTLLFGLCFLVPAAAIDYRTREVPDLISYGLIIFSIGYGVLRALSASSYAPLAQMGIGVAIMGIVGVALFYSGQWGGADTKLLIGLGALLGIGFGTYDAVLFLILMLVAGAAWGLLFAAKLALQHRKEFVAAFKRLLREGRIHSVRRVVILGCFAALAALAFVPAEYRLALIVIGIGAYVVFYTWLCVKSVEEAILIRKYPVGKLTEGDWVYKDVVVQGRRVCGPKDLGVSKEQIAQLKRLKVRTVMVKEGVPFVPSFLVAYLLLWLAGDALQRLLPAFWP